jgi:hypothetical protein
MSIRPATIDRNGDRPCLPTGSLLAVCKQLAHGRTPTLRERVAAALAELRKKLAQ